MRPRTILTYFGNLRTLFRYLVEEGAIDSSPMESLRPPVSRGDQIVPFSPEQIRALLAVTRRSRQPKRDEAIVLFLLDTGCRASELCALRLCEVDLM